MKLEKQLRVPKSFGSIHASTITQISDQNQNLCDTNK